MVLAQVFSWDAYYFNPYSWVYLTSFCIVLFLGLYVLLKNPKSKINRSFMSLMICFMVWFSGVVMVLNSKIAEACIFWGKFVYIGVIFIPFCSYLVSYFYVKAKNRQGILITVPLISLVYIFLTWSTDLIIAGAHPAGKGYFFTNGGAWHVSFLVFFCSVASISFIEYFLAFKRFNTPEKRKMLMLMMFSYFLGYFGSLDFLPGYEIDIQPYGFIAEVMFSIFVVYVIRRYKIYIVEPVFESEKVAQKHNLNGSTAYFVRENQGATALTIFTDQVLGGKQGLFITRSNPEILRRDTPLKKTPIIWLTEVAGENTVDPSRIEELAQTVTNFVDNAEDSIVLIEGIPYLSSYCEFNLILRFIRTLKDKISTKKAILMVSLDPKNFNERDFSLIADELKEYNAL
jgi:hypothetical protein